MIDELLADVMREEGWRDHVYDDATGEPVLRGSTVEGYATIGWGFCVDQRRGRPLPKDIAELWLRRIVADVWAELTSRAPWVMDQPSDVQRALCSMAYQMGVSGVLGFRRMCEALRRGDRAAAAAEALDSRWATQTPARARRVAALIRG